MKRPFKAEILDIDRSLLVEECEHQPKLCFQYIENLADTKKDLAEEKAELDVVKAEEELKIRTDPIEFGLKEKPTETSIKTVLVLNERIREHESIIRGLQHSVDILAGAVTAIDQRKRMLEKMVDLHGQQYYATPKFNPDAAEAYEGLLKRRAKNKNKKKLKRSKTSE